ncbi:MAG: hypothetical protein KF837_06815 [Labilithrix sp.]|nr:hypothetical protein [Labilithrix sp.]
MGLVLSAPMAYADESAAETLFEEGLAAMKRNDLVVACEAFAKSNKADPSPGTQINLAICFEKQKKWASAWTWYRSAQGLAQQRHQPDREKSAEEAANRLKPQLHYVIISVKDAPSDLVVKRDGAEVTVTLAGKEVPLPIDPGEHSIEASAPGKKAQQRTIVVADTPVTERVELGPLEDAPAEPGTPVVTPGAGGAATGGAPSSDGSGQRTIGLIVGGAGILTGIASVGVLILGLNQASERDKLITDLEGLDQKKAAGGADFDRQAYVTAINDKNSAAKNDQLIAIILGAGAGAMVGLGAVLYFTAPKAKTARLVPLPVITPTFAGLGLGGAF